MRSGSVPSSRAIAMVWAERPGWRSMSTTFAFFTGGSFQRREAFEGVRYLTARIYGGKQPHKARVGSHFISPGDRRVWSAPPRPKGTPRAVAANRPSSVHYAMSDASDVGALSCAQDLRRVHGVGGRIASAEAKNPERASKGVRQAGATVHWTLLV